MRSIFKTVILGKGGGVAGPPPDPPALTSITPDFGAIGAEVVIAGTDLDVGGLSLTLDATSFNNIVVDSAIQITADVPSVAAGVYDVNITTAGGSDSLPNAFRVLSADAAAFLAAAAITDETISLAIDDLVLGLQLDGLWDMALAIYPLVGGTAAAHKWNLKDPQDTDGAYRLTYSDLGITHSSNGMVGDGVDGYADTKFTPAMFPGFDDLSFGVYVRNNVSENKFDIGVWDSGLATEYALGTRRAGDLIVYVAGVEGAETFGGITDSRGFTLIDRVGTSLPDVWKNGTLIATGTGLEASDPTNREMYLMARNDTGTAADFTTRQLAFAWIGAGLGAVMNADLYTRIQAFQTALGRQV